MMKTKTMNELRAMGKCELKEHLSEVWDYLHMVKAVDEAKKQGIIN